jgi:alpha-galactosidase
MTQQNTQHPKVVVIGAGSLFFGRQVIWQMTHSPHLWGGTLALVDTDARRLESMARLAEKVAAFRSVPLAVEASTDRRGVLKDADFVVLSFADRSAYFRGIDCAVSLGHGIRMCSGDTIGPGGIFRAMREMPVILACARDAAELCPDAWVINYVNPTAVMGIGLRRYAPEVKSFALCDGLHMPHVKHQYAMRADIVHRVEEYTDDIDSRFDLRIAGVNHFTWVLKAEYEGVDVVPALVAAMRRDADAERTLVGAGSKRAHNNAIGVALYEAFGYLPACIAHTKEYVRFWQGRGTSAESIPPLPIWDPVPRYALHDGMWEQVDSFLNGETPLSEFSEMFGPDAATDVIETFVGRLDKPFYLNTPNGGAIDNMAPDAFLELLCDVNPSGPTPRPVGEMPRGLRGMQELVLDTHELTAKAVAECDVSLLRRAMLTDPLVTSIADADAIVAALLKAQRDVLPACWYD